MLLGCVTIVDGTLTYELSYDVVVTVDGRVTTIVEAFVLEICAAALPDEATTVVLLFKLDELLTELLLLLELFLLAELDERFELLFTELHLLLLLIELELLLFKLNELLVELLLTELELRFLLLLELLLLVKLDELLETCSTTPVAVAVIHA